MRSEEEIIQAIDCYADTVKRVCFLHLKNEADTEDIFQTVFLKYALDSTIFESREHEKAWILRVTINACKDLLKSFFRTKTVSFTEDITPSYVASDEKFEIIDCILRLPVKYRRVIYLHYYEGYTAPEISRIIGKNVNSVYTLITRGKNLLKVELGGAVYDE